MSKTRSPLNWPVMIAEPSADDETPLPNTSSVPPARVAQTHSPVASILATKKSQSPALVNSGSDPNVTVPSKSPVTIAEPSSRVDTPHPTAYSGPPARVAQPEPKSGTVVEGV